MPSSFASTVATAPGRETEQCSYMTHKAKPFTPRKWVQGGQLAIKQQTHSRQFQRRLDKRTRTHYYTWYSPSIETTSTKDSVPQPPKGAKNQTTRYGTLPKDPKWEWTTNFTAWWTKRDPFLFQEHGQTKSLQFGVSATRVFTFGASATKKVAASPSTQCVVPTLGAMFAEELSVPARSTSFGKVFSPAKTTVCLGTQRGVRAAAHTNAARRERRKSKIRLEKRQLTSAFVRHGVCRCLRRGRDEESRRRGGKNQKNATVQKKGFELHQTFRPAHSIPRVKLARGLRGILSLPTRIRSLPRSFLVGFRNRRQTELHYYALTGASSCENIGCVRFIDRLQSFRSGTFYPRLASQVKQF